MQYQYNWVLEGTSYPTGAGGVQITSFYLPDTSIGLPYFRIGADSLSKEFPQSSSVRVNDYLKGLKERERENLMISINSFVTARLEKIVKLAAASPLSPELAEKLSAEERYLYDIVHNSTDSFKRKVIKRFD